MQTILGKSLTSPALLQRFAAPQAPVPFAPCHPPLARVNTLVRPAAGVLRPALPLVRPQASACSDRSLIEALTCSRIYQEYEQAFTEATGLPVSLRPVESWQLPLHGKRHEAPYCAMMSEKSRACASCLQMQERLSKAADQQSQTMVCPAGLSETAVPVRLGDRLIGFLMTGQVFRKKPTQAQFDHTMSIVDGWGLQVDRAEVKEAYFATRVMPQKQQDSATVLLRIFAQHLSMLSNQVMVQQQNAEPPAITKAKAYIQEHYSDDLSLGEVAKAVSSSPFYFCKVFRKAAGINFTDYVSRVRIEKSKNLLLNPNLRVSEIAYEVGFQSLTHFNRVFRKLMGQSPTDYRLQLGSGHGAPHAHEERKAA